MTDVTLTCQELVELVTEYLEGALPAAERNRFEEHLSNCRGCTNYVEQMRQTIHLSGRLTEEQIAPEAKQKLLDTFRNWNKL
jgi:predicted anti-sigma-YlaC factor YlaD